MNRVFGLARNVGVWFWQEEFKEKRWSLLYSFVEYRRFLFRLWLVISLFWFAYSFYHLVSFNPLVILGITIMSLSLSAACVLTLFMVWKTLWGIWKLGHIYFNDIKAAVKNFIGMSLREKLFYLIFFIILSWLIMTGVDILRKFLATIPFLSDFYKYGL